jgi:hypothetical protein
VADKIVGNVRDYQRLNALGRVQKAANEKQHDGTTSSVALICSELAKYIKDQEFVRVALEAILEGEETLGGALRSAYGYPSPRAVGRHVDSLQKSGGMNLILDCMSHHSPSSARIPELGFTLLNIVSLYSRKGSIDSLNSSHGIGICVEAAKNNSKDDNIWAKLFALLNNLEQAAQLVGREAYSSHLQGLQDANVLPLAFYALQRFPSNRMVALDAMCALQKPVGGQDIPVLRAIVAADPDGFQQAVDRAMELHPGTDGAFVQLEAEELENHLARRFN